MYQYAVDCVISNSRPITNSFNHNGAAYHTVSYTHLDVYKRQRPESSDTSKKRIFYLTCWPSACTPGQRKTLIPQEIKRSWKWTIEVSIKGQDPITAAEKFNYVSKTIVGTVAGYVDETGKAVSYTHLISSKTKHYRHNNHRRERRIYSQYLIQRQYHFPHTSTYKERFCRCLLYTSRCV